MTDGCRGSRRAWGRMWRCLGAAAVGLGLTACGCPTAYLYDGTSGPGARPYYKIEACKGQKPRIICDSPNRLPNEDCK